MKPPLPHPLYHFEEDFRPRPKLAAPRGFNWPLLVGLVVSAAIAIGALIFVAVKFGGWRFNMHSFASGFIPSAVIGAAVGLLIVRYLLRKAVK